MFLASFFLKFYPQASIMVTGAIAAYSKRTATSRRAAFGLA